MITVKAKDLKNPMFIGGFQKLVNFPFKKATTAMTVAQTIHDIQKKTQSLQDQFINLVKMYGKIEEDGSYKISDEHLETWKKASAEFDEQDIELMGYKIAPSELDGAGFTPAEINACKPLINALEVAQ